MKFRTYILLFLSIFFWIPLAQARIVEETKMARVISYVDENTLLVFDLDSTVMKTMQMLGSDPWFYDMVNKNMGSGMNEEDANDKALSVWRQIQKVTAVQPVEPDTPKLIKEMQDKNIAVMALTARPLDFAEDTVRQLQSINIDFTRHPPYGNNIHFKSLRKLSRYYKGILFVGELNDKGISLDRFLKQINYAAKNIVFVDDRLRNVEAVDNALRKRGIECYCVRYGGADDDIKRFNGVIADVELKFFGKILTDEAARAIADSRQHK